MKKNIIFLVIGGFVLLCFIIGTSLLWYNLFSGKIVETAKLDIQLANQESGVTITSASPVEDAAGEDQSPYAFSVSNRGNIVGSYKLIIEDTPFNKIEDGCTADTLLDRSQLRYQLLLNGKELIVDDLANVKNNIIDFREIAPNVENKYELRVWVKEKADSTDWENKHYHYSVTIVPDSKEE